ncbi:MAG: hypothetical protein FP816_20145 [Desulfobacteraceae bacterium]|nr:hypothetical protein [Desulfobacteraceae bacterium]MBU4001010.1 hypothetical protein [Pseudomonadota bacterium]MBU4053117.1 hypothetical protein [Pseudomonadota bacterium]
MTGLENISAHNGWAIVCVGVSIVVSGLATLSFAIAQLHKLLGLWDNRRNLFQKFKNRKENMESQETPVLELSLDVQENIRNFKLLTAKIGDPFSLPKLIEYSEKCGLKSPLSTINTLLTAKVIVPDGNGYFKWFN